MVLWSYGPIGAKNDLSDGCKPRCYKWVDGWVDGTNIKMTTVYIFVS